MIEVKKVEDVIEGAKGTRTGTSIIFFVPKDEHMKYVDGNLYVGFTDEEGDWFVFKVVTRTKINNINIIYEAVFFGSWYDKHRVFDKMDIDKTQFVNIVDNTIIEIARDRARCN